MVRARQTFTSTRDSKRFSAQGFQGRAGFGINAARAGVYSCNRKSKILKEAQLHGQGAVVFQVLPCYRSAGYSPSGFRSYQRLSDTLFTTVIVRYCSDESTLSLWTPDWSLLCVRSHRLLSLTGLGITTEVGCQVQESDQDELDTNFQLELRSARMDVSYKTACVLDLRCCATPFVVDFWTMARCDKRQEVPLVGQVHMPGGGEFHCLLKSKENVSDRIDLRSLFSDSSLVNCLLLEGRVEWRILVLRTQQMTLVQCARNNVGNSTHVPCVAFVPVSVS